jgi:hypothetical protein
MELQVQQAQDRLVQQAARATQVQQVQLAAQVQPELPVQGKQVQLV